MEAGGNELVERDRAIEAHYRKNYKGLVSLLGKRRGQADAEDIVQEAYARALQYWEGYSPEIAPFNQWFGMILKNTIRRYQMEAEKHGAASLDTIAEEELVVQSMDLEQLIHVKEALAEALHLSPVHRQVIYMRAGLGYTQTEISHLLPVSIVNVKKIVQRFREKVT